MLFVAERTNPNVWKYVGEIEELIEFANEYVAIVDWLACPFPKEDIHPKFIFKVVCPD